MEHSRLIAVARTLVQMAWLMVIVASGMAVNSHVSAAEASLEVREEKGFGRLIFSFDRVPEYKVSSKSGVLVLTFSEKVNLNLDTVASRMPGYIIIARLDPDGRAVRLALTQELKINTILAGDKLFVDLLPSGWTGLPPGLPAEVIAELSRRAREAEARARRKAAMKEALDDKNRLKLRVGRLPTFSRLSFQWNVPVSTQFSRKKNVVTLVFNRVARLDLGHLNADPPRFMKSIRREYLDAGMKVEITVDRFADVRGFREDNTYIVDITGEDNGPTEPAVKAVRGRQLVPPLPPVPKAAETVQALGKRSANPVPKSSDGERKAVKAPPSVQPKMPPKPSLKAKVPTEETGKPVVATTEKPVEKLAAKRGVAAKGTTEPAAKVAPGMIRGKPGGKKPGRVKPASAPAEETPAKNRPGKEPLKATAELIGNSLKMTFPYRNMVPMAVFRRGPIIWVMFDSSETLNIADIRAKAGDRFERIDFIPGTDTQLLRFWLNERQIVSTSRDDKAWIVAVGDLVLERMQPLLLKRDLREDGRSLMRVKLPGAGRVHWLDDPVFEDRLAIVTATGPVRGVSKHYSFVEFNALATNQGVVVQPLADDLAVRINLETVLITRDEGLNLSDGLSQQYAAGQKGMSTAGKAGYLDFKKWAKVPGDQVLALQNRLLVEANTEDKDKRSRIHLQQARLYLGRLLGPEALGALDLALENAPNLEVDPHFNAMRGVAALLSNRLKLAAKQLGVHGLQHDSHARLWRGLLNAYQNKWPAAWKEFRGNTQFLEDFPPDVQAMLRPAIVHAALENGETGAAKAELHDMPEELAKKIPARIALLRGRVLEAQGQTQSALAAYDEAAAGKDRKIETRARFRAITLRYDLGKITIDDAIKELEGISYAWRGDDVELSVLRELAQLYVKKKRFRRALETMKMAVIAHARSPKSRLVQHDMETLFRDLFLHEKAEQLDPIKGLALFYDFRELIPPGRTGDDIIRKLANHLMMMDLFSQAEKLLSYQIENRLVGAARAQVAAQLALVYLTDHKPEKALKTIRRSRQAGLPKSLNRQRSLLEARALVELGRTGQAMELLGDMKGQDVERLKAEALWNGSNWQMAGEQYERILGDAWKRDGPLSDRERLDALRAAIAMTMADDRLGLERLREKYAAKMTRSPDGAAFTLITETENRHAADFREVASKVASMDTLEAFVKEMRARRKTAAAKTAAGS